MPAYNYKCPSCETRFEARHGFNDEPPACPQCGHVPVQRIIVSAPTVAGGMLTHPGDGRRASKEQLQSKWAEETPKLRKQLEDKLGRDTVKRNMPTFYSNDS